VQYGLQPQGGQQGLSAGLRGPVAGQKRFFSIGAQPHRQQSGGGRNGPVQDHRDLSGGTAQVKSCHRRNVKPTHLTENVHWIAGVGPVDLQGPLHRLALARQPRVRQSGPPAHRLLGGETQQGAGHRRRGGGVANAHLPGGQEGIPILRQLPGQGEAHGQGPLRRLPRHGRAFRHVLGAPLQHHAGAHAGWRVPPGHAQIHREHLGPGRPGHVAHGGAPLPHSLGYRPGDLLAGLGDPLGHHAVVGAEHRHGLPAQVQVRTAGHSGHSDQQVLQPAQPPEGLGNGVPPAAGRLHGPPVRRGDGRYLLWKLGPGHRAFLS